MTEVPESDIYELLTSHELIYAIQPQQSSSQRHISLRMHGTFPLSIFPSIHRPIHLSIIQSVGRPTCLPVCLSACQAESRRLFSCSVCLHSTVNLKSVYSTTPKMPGWWWFGALGRFRNHSHSAPKKMPRVISRPQLIWQCWNLSRSLLGWKPPNIHIFSQTLKHESAWLLPFCRGIPHLESLLRDICLVVFRSLKWLKFSTISKISRLGNSRRECTRRTQSWLNCSERFISTETRHGTKETRHHEEHIHCVTMGWRRWSWVSSWSSNLAILAQYPLYQLVRGDRLTCPNSGWMIEYPSDLPACLASDISAHRSVTHNLAWRRFRRCCPPSSSREDWPPEPTWAHTASACAAASPSSYSKRRQIRYNHDTDMLTRILTFFIRLKLLICI